ncbi:hypothetical protein BKA70DRAFT_1285887 [Coprinopsis sp. MPI-PUGE-AT-0042]|nr:hypothetical protein BKA70DRAFT_1285887 [Coprinopsis sp. MPI-PUGE-AT-0042]
MTNLEQADDILLMSTTADGLQRKLDGVANWCAKNFMLVNEVKTVAMVLGHKPRTVPTLQLRGTPTRIVEEQSYIGFRVSSKGAEPLRHHYNDKAEKAASAGRAACGIDGRGGKMPTWDALMLYNAYVDSHLTHGCEVILDSNRSALSLLERTQKGFLRRMLGLGDHCIVVALYSETGVMPIVFRRLLLAIDYLRYLVALPMTHFARLAVEEALQLDLGGHQSWISRLRKVVTDLPFHCLFPAHDELRQPKRVGELAKEIAKGVRDWLRMNVETSKKLYLIHGRGDDDDDDTDRKVKKPARYRDYLNVANREHRVALTRLLVSNHCYGLEVGRYHNLDEADRICRYCREATESPEHVLLQCQGNAAITMLREAFGRKLVKEARVTEVQGLCQLDGRPREQLRMLVSLTSLHALTSLVAKFAYDVQQVVREGDDGGFDPAAVADLD